jgi:transcription antitermination factor NusG
LLKLDRSYNWHAVYTKSRREKELERDLIEDGHEVYLPKIKRLHSWSDRKKMVEMPVFPGYVFVRVSNREYYKVLQHPGAVKYVGFGGIPAKITEQQIEGIKRVLGLNLDFEVTTDNFKKGEIVEITAGPMVGCRGEIISVTSKKKLLIRIKDIGYSLVVSVPPAYLDQGLRLKA